MFFILDVPSSTARLVDRDGGTRYLDGGVCRRVLHNRRNDVENPLHIIKYTPGHYKRVRWPREGLALHRASHSYGLQEHAQE